MYPDLDESGSMYRDRDVDDDMERLVRQTKENDEKRKPKIWNFMKRKDGSIVDTHGNVLKSAFGKEKDPEIEQLEKMGYDVPDDVPERNTTYKGGQNSIMDNRDMADYRRKMGSV